jgi:hypothetical protein
MTKQEKWNEIVRQIEELGDELQELVDEQLSVNEGIEMALMSLRMSVDELSDQEVEEC